MFRSTALGMVSVLALTVSASAADLGGPGFKDGPYGPPDPWTGLYIGANVGVASGTAGVTDVDGFATTGSKSLTTSGDVFGGGTAGFNLQRGVFVFGVEGDAGYMGLSGNQVIGSHAGSITVAFPPAAAAPVTPYTGNWGTVSQNVDPGFYADLTGRLGYSVGRMLFYGKAGLALYEGERQTNGLWVTNVDNYYDVAKGGSVGWTAGGGLEYAFNSLVSFKVEYQHFDFGTENSTLTLFAFNHAATNATPTQETALQYKYEHTLQADSFKFGVNFHVQPPEPPLPMK